MNEPDRRYHAAVTDPVTGDVVELRAATEEELDQLVEQHLQGSFPHVAGQDDAATS
jgi:hypothetical protein